VGANVGGDLAPLGITLVAAYVREKNFSVDIIDAVIENYEIADTIKKIVELNPKAVGLSALTSNFYRAVATAKEIKKVLPHTLVIIGGHHATLLPNEVMKENYCFDVLVRGEGEITAEELMRVYKEVGWSIKKLYGRFREIKSICFREGSEIISTDMREPIEDLDSMPFAARDLLPMHKYLPLPNQYKRRPVVNMVVIRGCAFDCSFCSAK
jgi:radical SAM superfamily enzyme YgiQ (UPF0313 family)